MVLARLGAHREWRDLHVRGAAPRDSWATEGLALRLLSEVHEHVPELSKALVAWASHVGTHRIDARSQLRVARAQPDADAKDRASQALTLEVRRSIRISHLRDVARAVRVHGLGHDVLGRDGQVVLGEQLGAHRVDGALRRA